MLFFLKYNNMCTPMYHQYLQIFYMLKRVKLEKKFVVITISAAFLVRVIL